MSFFAELKRRNVFKVGIAYAIVAWLLIQVIVSVEAPLRLPDWTDTFIIILLIIGFPVALIFAWAFELTPEGLKPTDSVPAEKSITHATGRKLDFIIIGVLALALAFVLVDKYVLTEDRSQESGARSENTQDVQQAITDKGQVTEIEILPNSVAVLPFENMTKDENNAYFAAGLHEEILNQLAKLKNLNVIARTTMVHYANSDKPMKQVANELKVQTVMEGSVRYADGRVRVTTQLIDPARDVHLWSETYDYELKDIFGIESDVAMNVANALAAEFSVEEQARIEEIPTKSPQAYALYLEAQGLARRETLESTRLAVERLKQALELDPNFAQGWLSLSFLYINFRTKEYQEEAEHALQRALEINPALPGIYPAISYVAGSRGDWQRAEEALLKAQSLGIPPQGRGDDLHRTVLGFNHGYWWLDKALLLDPLSPSNSFMCMHLYDAQGNAEAALAEYERGRQLFSSNYGFGHTSAVTTLLGKGDYERARKIDIREFKGPLAIAIEAYGDKPDELLAEMNTLYTNKANQNLDKVRLAIWAAYLGDEKLALNALSGIYDAFPPNIFYVWRPLFRDVRRDPGFKDLVRKIGFVDFWQKYGWPDLCKPVGEDDFECI